MATNHAKKSLQVNLKSALKYFYKNASFEVIFEEAVANALDADATKIDIEIEYNNNNNKIEIDKIIITDNGCGFNDIRFKKFNTLLEDQEDNNHKGLGRLVYLKYFKTIKIESVYDIDFKKRQFTFDLDGTTETNLKQNQSFENKNYTKLKFTNFISDRIHNKSYLEANAIKKILYERFLPRLYKLKEQNKIVEINITTNKTDTELLNNNKLPVLKEINFDDLQIKPQTDLFSSKIKYAINVDPNFNSKDFITGFCIDDRIYKGLVNVIDDSNLPNGTYIFLLFSNSISVNADREKISEDTINLKKINNIFRNKIISLLETALPNLRNSIQQEANIIEDKYPHLNNYIEKKQVGFVKSEDLIKDAQEKFSKEQMDVIEKADNMTDRIYQKSLDLSARTLANYILFRKFIIQKFKQLTANNLESEIHKLILPKGKHKNPNENIYQNNVWLLDDKFMSFEFALSDQKLKNLKEYLYSNNSELNGNNEPDICLVFNKDPENIETKKFDVVIIELKRKKIDFVNAASKIEDQLLNTAINLAKFYHDKIENIWFYGCLDINEEIKQDLKNKYSGRWKKIFSTGDIYIQSTTILENTISLDLFLLSYQTLGDDAEIRNKTFLNILKNSFNQSSEDNSDE